MARTKINVDPKELQDAINTVEKTAKFDTRAKLFQAVADTEWAKGKKLSPSILAARFNEFKLLAETRKSKPGRPKGVKKKADEKVLEMAAADAVKDIEEVTEGGNEPDID